MDKSNKIKILNINFDNISSEEALRKTILWLDGNEQKHITTPNPEMLLAARTNPKFLKTISHSDLKIADGIGVLWAAKYQDAIKNNKSATVKFLKWLSTLSSIPFRPKNILHPLKERVTGSDLMKEICEKARKDEKVKIFLLGAKEGVAEKVKEKLDLNAIVGTYAGSPAVEEDKKIQSLINASGANLLFVAYGAPVQEIWIARNLHQLANIKVAIGVGGAFDFIAEVKKRAPQWMRKVGLEWLYRLIQEPKRIKRIYNATIKFPITVLKENLKN